MSFSVSLATTPDTLTTGRGGGPGVATTPRSLRAFARLCGRALTVSLSLVVIEDHEALREGLVLLLDARGCDVLGCAATRREGLALIARHHPDVALVDINL